MRFLNQEQHRDLELYLLILCRDTMEVTLRLIIDEKLDQVRNIFAKMNEMMTVFCFFSESAYLCLLYTLFHQGTNLLSIISVIILAKIGCFMIIVLDLQEALKIL